MFPSGSRIGARAHVTPRVAARGYHGGMATVPRLEITAVVDFVNHYSVRARRAAQDEDKGYRSLDEVLGPVAQDLPPFAVEKLHTLADDAYEVFVRSEHDEDVTAAVNDLLAPAGPTPRLGTDGQIAWEVADGRATLRAALGVGLLDWVHVRGADRLGLCEGVRCADAFADSSPAGRKKFCSAGCLNRHKVAEHRRRAAAGPG